MYTLVELIFTNKDADPEVMILHVAPEDVEKVLKLYSSVYSGDDWVVTREEIRL